VPPLPSPGNVLKIDLLWSDSADNNISTRLFFKYTGGAPAAADCVTIATTAGTEAYSYLGGLISTFVTMLGATCQDLSSDTGNEGVYSDSHAGGRTGEPLPAGVAFLVNYGIGRHYRGGKPRSYFPFGTAVDLATAQTWDSTILASVNSDMQPFSQHISGTVAGSTTVGPQCNVSYYQGFTSVENPLTHRWRNVPTLRSSPVVDTITSWSGNEKPGSQRRRYQR
jgi:hypothetical protein